MNQMVKKFYFMRKVTQKPSLGGRMVTDDCSSMMLRFEARGGLQPVVSLSLVRVRFAGTKHDTLFMVGCSLMRGVLSPFVAGSKVPGKQGFGVDKTVL